MNLRKRVAVGTIACVLALSAAVITSAPGSAAPKSKPKPTPTVTSTPTPTASPTISPTPTPSPTSSPTPTSPPPLCESMTTFGTVEYCVTTLTAVATGKHAAGAAIAVRAAWVMEVSGNQVVLGSWDCPPGMFCGATITTVLADFSNAQPLPALDSFVDVYATVTSDFNLLVTGYT